MTRWLSFAMVLSGCGLLTVGPGAGASDAGSVDGGTYAACTGNNRCGSGETCFTSYSGGMCSKLCSTDAVCGDELCRAVGGLSMCLKRCAVAADCRADLDCVAASPDVDAGLACSKTANEAQTITVSGATFTVRDALFVQVTDAVSRAQYLSIMLVDQPNFCGHLRANSQPGSGSAMVMTLFDAQGESGTVVLAQPSPGAFSVNATTQIPQGLSSTVQFSQTNASCLTTVSVKAQTGSVSISSLNPVANGVLTGVYALGFAGQSGSVSGPINAHFCDVTALGSNPACQ